MKELLRIVHGRLDEGGESRLEDYNLEVFAGDILYIQGMEGSGIRTLVHVLAGDAALQQGKLLLGGREVSDYTRSSAKKYEIYTITAERDLVEGLSVMDNLEGIRHVSMPLQVYPGKRARKQVTAYLESAQIDARATDEVWQLSQRDRKKLSILKARLHGARLIILDATHGSVTGREGDELCALIKSASAEGVTFIILTRHYEVFAEIASRIQLISDGIDIKEWEELTPRVRLRLQNPAAHQVRDTKAGEQAFIGIYDKEWEMEDGIWHYLTFLREQNRALWEEVIDAELPEDGVGFSASLAIIPAGGSAFMVSNLSLADNLILSMPERVSRFGFIPNRVQEMIVKRFYAETGISSEKKRMAQLDRLEQKLFLVYRAALKKPRCIILETPYTGLTLPQADHLREYMMTLAQKGMKIIYFSREPEEMEKDCKQIICASGGRSAKISTYSQFFPPR